MAMLMAAPANGWGMVGIAPNAVRVYSLRAAPAGESSFPFGDYSKGIGVCEKLEQSGQFPIKVIALSLGGVAQPSSLDLGYLENAVDLARAHGLDVVAAGGDGGAAVDYPAAYPPVVAVGAEDASSGAPCAFGPRGAGLDVLAPGCDGQLGGIEQAFADDGSPAAGDGTSQATAIVAAVLAALRAYAPSLSVDQAETCVTSTERGGNLDAAAAFRSCGLGSEVDDGTLAKPVIPPMAAPTSPTTLQRRPGPRIAIRWAGRQLMVVALDRPPGAVFQVQVLARHARGSIVITSAQSRSGTVRLRTGTLVELRGRYRLTDHSLSRWTYVVSSRR
jgi:hypothetical protein